MCDIFSFVWLVLAGLAGVALSSPALGDLLPEEREQYERYLERTYGRNDTDPVISKVSTTFICSFLPFIHDQEIEMSIIITNFLQNVYI